MSAVRGRALSALVCLAGLLARGAEAQEEEAPLGLLITHATDAELTYTHWPEKTRFVLGSGPRSEVELPGLEAVHARFVVKGDQIFVTPVGPVELNGARLKGRREVTVDDRLTLGPYQVSFFFEREEEVEDVPPEPEEEVEPTAEQEGPAPRPLPEGAKPMTIEEAAKAGEEARGPALSPRSYRFCHDPRYGRDGTDGVDFCPIFDEQSDDVCPEARAHCKEWREAEGFSLGGGKDGKGKSRRLRIVRKSPSLTLPALPAWLSYGILGFAVAAALVWFLRSLKKAGWEDEDGLGEERPLSEAERNLQALPEARSSALLRQAERALERGDAAEAAVLIHLAVLRHLDDEGLARYHPSKTNGDYLRAIRRHKELAALFRAVAFQTERLRFGDGQVDTALLPGLLGEARRVLAARSVLPDLAQSPGTAALLLGLGAAGLSGCPQDPDLAYHSHGPAGMAALPALLRQAGMTVEISRVRFNKISPDVGAVVLRSSAAHGKKWPTKLRIDALLDRELSVVVIDDLWQARFFMPATSTPSLARTEVVDLAMPEPRVDLACSLALLPLSPLLASGVKLPAGRRIAADTELAGTASASAKLQAMHPILEDVGPALNPRGQHVAYGYVAERVTDGQAEPGCLYVFADRDLFTNASLSRRANAAYVTAFFAGLVPAGHRVLFIDRLDDLVMVEGDGEDGEDGDTPESPTKALQASNLLPFILQGMAALIALYVFLGAAFGPLRDRQQKEHKAFIEHVEAIGRQYAKTGMMGRTHAARALARLVVMRYRDQVRGGPSGGWAAVAAHLAQRTELLEADVKAALRLGIDGVSELGAPGPDDPTPASERMLRTLGRLLVKKEKR